MLLVEDEVLPPVHDVRCRPWLTIGPFQASTEVERPLRGVLVGLPGLNQAGTYVQPVVEPSQQRMAVHVLLVGARGRVRRVQTQVSAVLPGSEPAVRHHVRVLGQSLLERWQGRSPDSTILASIGASDSCGATGRGFATEPLPSPARPRSDSPPPLPRGSTAGEVHPASVVPTAKAAEIWRTARLLGRCGSPSRFLSPLHTEHDQRVRGLARHGLAHTE